MSKRKSPEWLRYGDCSKCAHKNQCVNRCQANIERANAYIKKALLMDMVRRNAIC